MRGHSASTIGAVLAALTLASCRHADDTGLGRLTLDRTAPRAMHLADLPARAFYCSRDSQLTIVTEGGPWSAAFALRTAWPPQSAYTINQTTGSPGTGLAAARSVADSVRPALVAIRGSVTLQDGPSISGRFSFETGGDSQAVRLSGSFEGMRPDTAGCPG
jgi:hypothetical protein